MAERQPEFSERKVRRLEFTVVLSIVGFALVFTGLSIWAGAGTVIAHVRSLSVDLLAALLGLSLVNYALRAWRWQVFAKGLNIQVPLARNLLYFVAGFSMTTTPGKAGEALRLWLIERCHGYSYQRIAPMFVADRLNDMVAISLLGLAGVGAFSAYADVTLIGAAALGLIMLAFFRPSALIGLTTLAYRVTGRRRARLFSGIRAALRGTARLFTLRAFGFGLVLALLGWSAEIFEFHLLLKALGASTSLQQAMFIFTFAMAAGTLAMLPGGLGGTEAVMIALLTACGVDLDRAIAATAVIRLTTLWFATGLGFATLPATLRLARQPAAPLVAEPAE
jgi:uncharacterized protein (TIRG00374 family)